MHCTQFRELLADYVAGELAHAPRAAADAHLAQCGACRELARGLSAAAAVLEGGRITASEADNAVRELVLPATIAPTGPGITVSAPSPSSRVIRLSLVALRYAAVIGIAFMGGYAVRDRLRSPEREVRPELTSATPAPEVALNPTYATRFRAAESAYPNAPSLARSLLAIARP